MQDTSRSDAELIQSILASNQRDFELLVERYQQKIYSYLYRFLYQNQEAAQDVTQDVFIKVYQNLASADPNRPLQPWIYRIAHNEAANYLRKMSRKKETYLQDEQWASISGEDGEDLVTKEDNRQLILKALDKIDTKYREVLVLYFFEDKSYQEIAEILESSTNSVGTLIRRAKKQMEKTLEGIIGRKDWFLNIVLHYLLITFHLYSPPRLKGGSQ